MSKITGYLLLKNFFCAQKVHGLLLELTHQNNQSIQIITHRHVANAQKHLSHDVRQPLAFVVADLAFDNNDKQTLEALTCAEATATLELTSATLSPLYLLRSLKYHQPECPVLVVTDYANDKLNDALLQTAGIDWVIPRNQIGPAALGELYAKAQRKGLIPPDCEPKLPVSMDDRFKAFIASKPIRPPQW